MNKHYHFLAQAVALGLVIALFLLLVRPSWLEPERPVVEWREADRPPATSPPLPGTGPVSYATAVETAAPAVVNVYSSKVVTQRINPLLDDPLFQRFFGERLGGIPRKRLETSLGSGVIVSPQGYILTNNHVIAEAEEIRVALADGRTTTATLVGTDPDTDLAILQLSLPDVTAIILGRSDGMRVGDVVLAIGNPYGVGQTVTQGIVSALGRSQLGINSIEDFIQTDAAINPGNSGGALINAVGQLVGINTAIYSRSGGSQGIGFAIPVDLAKGVMRQIIEKGRVIRGWLGVELQDITPALAESFGLASASGAVVAGVARRGPAERAGIIPGDIITAVDGRTLPNGLVLMNHVSLSLIHI